MSFSTITTPNVKFSSVHSVQFRFMSGLVKYVFIIYSGTVIDQGEAPDFYFQKYPEDNPALGFFTWRWVLTLGFDHMFSSPLFLGSLALLGASLMACTYTTQIPLVRVARRSDFVNYPRENFKETAFIHFTCSTFGLK